MKILVPFDASPLSRKAVREAFEMYDDPAIIVYHVSSLYEPGFEISDDGIHEPYIGSDRWYAMERETAEEVLAEAESLAEEYGRAIETDWDIGDPVRLVPEYARDQDVDHVVMGVHGQADPDRSWIGRIAEAMAERSPVSVTLVR